jgi:hypothetical protein
MYEHKNMRLSVALKQENQLARKDTCLSGLRINLPISVPYRNTL